MRSTSGIDPLPRTLNRGASSARRFGLLGAMSLLVASPAAAEPSATDAVLAETLFREGKELMAAKQFDAACPKLAESDRLDPGTGTRLALALCHEGEGRIATAWIEFTDVLATTADARPDRALVAREHIAQIEPTLSKLTVIVPASLAEVPGFVLLRDNVRLDRPAWGTAVPLDGGAHTLEARGENRRARIIHFNIAATGERRVVAVPPLAAAPASASATTSSIAPADVPSSSPADAVRQRWGIALGALGVVGLGTGAYFGVSAISRIHQAKGECPAAMCTSQAPLNLNADGMRDATIADVALGAGLLAGAVGIFLILTGRAHGTQPPAGLRIVPSIDRFGASVAVVQLL
jgi:hypothetical protein